jgi:hypothetical protein
MRDSERPKMKLRLRAGRVGVGMMQKPALPVDRDRSSREGPPGNGRSSEMYGPMAATALDEPVMASPCLQAVNRR